MVKIEVKLVSSMNFIERTTWPKIEVDPNEPITTIQAKVETEEAWYFESKAKNGKWPDERIGGQREPEWKISISKDHPVLNGIKIEGGWNYEEKDYDYIYEIEFDENVGIVNEKNKKIRKFWKVDKGITNFTKKKNDEEREREREQNQIPNEMWQV